MKCRNGIKRLGTSTSPFSLLFMLEQWHLLFSTFPIYTQQSSDSYISFASLSSWFWTFASKTQSLEMEVEPREQGWSGDVKILIYSYGSLQHNAFGGWSDWSEFGVPLILWQNIMINSYEKHQNRWIMQKIGYWGTLDFEECFFDDLSVIFVFKLFWICQVLCESNRCWWVQFLDVCSDLLRFLARVFLIIRPEAVLCFFTVRYTWCFLIVSCWNLVYGDHF